MEFDGSAAAASSASSASPPPPAAPKRKAERKRPREAARHHHAHRGGAGGKGASELLRMMEIGGESVTLPDSAPAPVLAAGELQAAGTGEGRGAAGAESVSAKLVFVDEEAVFNMPELVEDMARGMMVAPPAFPWKDEEVDTCLIDLSLWKHD